MPKILIPVTNHAVLGDTDKANGTFAPELTHALDVEITIGDYDAIFYPGGFGLLSDLAVNEDMGQIAAQHYEGGGIIAAVCHGPGALLPITLSNGEKLLADKSVTGFTREEEIDFGTIDDIPFLLEESLTRTLAKKPLRIAMVDDDSDDIFLTKMAFKKHFGTVQFFGLNSSEDLFDYIKYYGIGSLDLLLLDVNMPVSGGHDTLATLKDYPHFDDLCAVMFSTSRLPADKKNALQLGATAYAVKPSTLKESGEFVEMMCAMIEAKGPVKLPEFA